MLGVFGHNTQNDCSLFILQAQKDQQRSSSSSCSSFCFALFQEPKFL